MQPLATNAHGVRKFSMFAYTWAADRDLGAWIALVVKRAESQASAWQTCP
ncbi:hypothetical protein BH09PSE5_BH09PSE5_33460 [soil metagenome]